MRIWSLHPKYLDAQGLVALWRETLLARAVLKGQTKGYLNHPQLRRFRAHAQPSEAVELYLQHVYAEAVARGYSFDRSKISSEPFEVLPIAVTEGQLVYEWAHLMRKLSNRSPQLYERWGQVAIPECHPLFTPILGSIEAWEKVSD